MLQCRRESQDVSLGILEIPSRQEQSSKRDEDVTTPASRPSSGEMRQPSSQRRSNDLRIQGRRFDESVHLHRCQLNGRHSELCLGQLYRQRVSWYASYHLWQLKLTYTVAKNGTSTLCGDKVRGRGPQALIQAPWHQCWNLQHPPKDRIR